MKQINQKNLNWRQKEVHSYNVASREIYKINKKRKREYTPYKACEEEIKEYQKKRSKLMDYERHCDNDGRWEENDQEEVKRIE